MTDRQPSQMNRSMFRRSMITPPLRATRRAWTSLGLGLLLLLGTWATVALVRYQFALSLVLLVASVAGAVMIRRSARSRRTLIAFGLLSLAAIFQAVSAFSAWRPVWITAVAVTLASAFVLLAIFFLDVIRASRAWRPVRRHATRSFSVLLGAVGALVSLLAVIVVASPAVLVAPLAALSDVRQSFEPEGPINEATELPTGTIRVSNVAYGNEYPNSFMDIYTAGESTVARPTYIYVHGGGWVGGARDDGDPLAGGGDGFAPTYAPAIEAGYNLVSVGYAFAPEYSYPTPVLQLTEAVRFLQERGAEYGIDMDIVVMGGGSAGGQISAQFANIQTNPSYAEEMGIEPVIPDNLKALALDSAALDFARLGQTQAPVLSLDFAYDLVGRTYLRNSSSDVEQANIIPHTTEDFPPTFISDGNSGTFGDQAKDLHRRLDDLGVANALYIPAASEGSVGHAFQVFDSRWTVEYNAEKYDFWDSVLN